MNVGDEGQALAVADDVGSDIVVLLPDQAPGEFRYGLKKICQR